MLSTLTLNVKVSCMLSSIAYCANPQKALNTYMKGWKIIWNPIAVNGTYAFVAHDPTQTMYVIAVRGSLLEFSWAAFDNWIYQDMNVATQVNWPYTQPGISNAKVSQGAWDALQDLLSMRDRGNLKSLLVTMMGIPAAAGIAVVGHSLGGNLATTCASWLHWRLNAAGQPRSNISVCTFAAPAAGNQFFAQDFNSKLPNSSRIENSNDIVPKFPTVGGVYGLGNLYQPVPYAEDIRVGYKTYTIALSTFFDFLSITLAGIEYDNGFDINNQWTNSFYTQPDNSGYVITVPLSGQYTTNDVTDWMEEAGYQHSINQYSAVLNVPIIDCVPSLPLARGKVTAKTKAKKKK